MMFGSVRHRKDVLIDVSRSLPSPSSASSSPSPNEIRDTKTPQTWKGDNRNHNTQNIRQKLLRNHIKLISDIFK